MSAAAVFEALVRAFLWFLLYGFAGWVYESIVVSVQERRPVNRGFLNGPIVPIYGVGAVVGVTLLGGIRSPALLFLAAAVGASVLEYFTSWAMERLFHARWWDYSNFRFNLNGRVCLLGAVIFGVGGVVIVKLIQPVVARWTDAVPAAVLAWLAGVLFVVFLVDLTITVAGMVDFAESLDRLVAVVQPVMAQYGQVARNVGGTVRQTVNGAVTGVSARVGEAVAKVENVSGLAASRVGERVGESLQGGKEMSLEMMLRVRDLAVSALNTQQRRMIASFPKLRTDRPGINETLRQLRVTLKRLYREGFRR